MFYRGFDGPLLRERFLEGNDTHEIKLILAVSRNANAQRAKFYCQRTGLAGTWTRQVERRGAWPQRGVAWGTGPSGGALKICWAGKALRAGKERLSDPGPIQQSGRAVLVLWHRLYPLPSLLLSANSHCLGSWDLCGLKGQRMEVLTAKGQVNKPSLRESEKGGNTPVSSPRPQSTGVSCLMNSSTASLRQPCSQLLIPTAMLTPPAWLCGSLWSLKAISSLWGDD